MKKLAAALVLAAAGAVFADTTPIMVSLVTPVQAPTSDYDVAGVRLSLVFGECRDFKGLDLGIANRSTGDFTGVGIGGANIADGILYGGHLGLVNWNGNKSREWATVSKGGQIGLVNYADSFCGLQDGVINVTDGLFTGLQSALLNVTDDLYGCQCGFYVFLGANIANGSVRGCQLGLVNYAEEMEKGLQVGIINIISRGGWAPVLPFVNGRF